MDLVDCVGLSRGFIVLWKNHVNLIVIDKCSKFIEVEILDGNGNDV